MESQTFQPEQPSQSGKTEQPSRRRALWRAFFAGLLSLVFPGLGQAVNRQWKKAVILGASTTALPFLSGWIGLVHTFSGLVTFVLLQAAILLLALFDAVRWARKARIASPPGFQTRLLIAAFFLLSIWHIYAAATDFYLDRVIGCRAYKIMSPSTNPTLVEGERVIADIHYYRRRALVRGDLVVYDREGVRNIKRVVAVGDDQVSLTADGLYINGVRQAEPFITQYSYEDFEGVRYASLKVPPGQVFLLGDNRSNSYDSRYWGPLPVERILGKVLYIYFSRQGSRIGKRVE